MADPKSPVEEEVEEIMDSPMDQESSEGGGGPIDMMPILEGKEPDTQKPSPRVEAERALDEWHKKRAEHFAAKQQTAYTGPSKVIERPLTPEQKKNREFNARVYGTNPRTTKTITRF